MIICFQLKHFEAVFKQDFLKILNMFESTTFFYYFESWQHQYWQFRDRKKTFNRNYDNLQIVKAGL